MKKINAKSHQSRSPLTLDLSLQTYLAVIEQLGSQQSSLWSDAAAQRAKQLCTLQFIPRRGLCRSTPSRPAGPAHLASPSSFSLSDPPHHIFTFHACVFLPCVRPTPGHCQLYVKFQESIPSAIGCKCSERRTADRQNCTFYRDVLRAEQSTTQPPESARPDSLPNKYQD